MSAHTFALDAPMSGELLQALVRARSGDDSGVDELISALNRLVFGIALGMLGNRADAEELAQDMFLRLIRGSTQFTSDEHLKAWTRRATVHACLKVLRKRRHHANLESIVGEVNGSDNSHGKLESADMLVKALAGLTERERAAFLLTVHIGLSSAEAADAMECTAGTVRSLSRRAREKLQPGIKRLRTWDTQDGR